MKDLKSSSYIPHPSPLPEGERRRVSGIFRDLHNNSASAVIFKKVTVLSNQIQQPAYHQEQNAQCTHL
jgi:hypothetical protein